MNRASRTPRPSMLRICVLVAAVVTSALLIAACGSSNDDSSKQQKQSVPQGSIPAFSTSALNALPTDGWITNGGSLNNQRYSPLDKINTDNVDKLGAVWKVDLKSGMQPRNSAEAQPIVYNGVIYTITGDDDVTAVKVSDGSVLWTYKANLDQKITTVCCGWTSRGVAIGDDHVYVGQLDGMLVALDSKTGKVDWQSPVGEWKKGETVTSAPLYYDGKVYSGISGGEYGIRGRLTAFDAKTGKELWKSYAIPARGEQGSETWPAKGDAIDHGGAPIWQTPAIDPETDTLYYSTGNVSPDFDGSGRPGDNLYSASIVAIDADTGTYKWHFQYVHHDLWDYDAPSPIVLFDTKIDGKDVKALVATAKTGWAYILDRTDGKPLIGIDEKPVPQDAKQHTAATQPYPRGDAFVPQEITPEENAELRKADPTAKWKYVNGGKIFTPFHGQDGVIAKPSTLGGTNWPPSSYSPDTGYLYICASDTISVFTSSEVQYAPGPIENGYSLLGSAFSAPKGVKMNGTVTAMDMTTNKIAWQNRIEGTNCYSGAVATAGGLVFVGENDGHLTALDAKTGKKLWSFQTGAGANSTVSTFEQDGTQYVTFYAGGSSLGGTPHGDNLWLFKLGGDMAEAPKPGPLAEAPDTSSSDTSGGVGTGADSGTKDAPSSETDTTS